MIDLRQKNEFDDGYEKGYKEAYEVMNKKIKEKIPKLICKVGELYLLACKDKESFMSISEKIAFVVVATKVEIQKILEAEND